MLAQREAEHRPVRVGLIGAGKFGSMYLSQALQTPGIHIVGVADRDIVRARAALERVGWPHERYAAASLDEALAGRSPISIAICPSDTTSHHTKWGNNDEHDTRTRSRRRTLSGTAEPGSFGTSERLWF